MGKRAQPKAKPEPRTRPRLQNKTSSAEATAAEGEMAQRSSTENMVRAVLIEVHDALGTVMGNVMFNENFVVYTGIYHENYGYRKLSKSSPNKPPISGNTSQTS